MRAAETALVSAAQTAALARIGAAGGSAKLDGSGLAVEIDLASERVFADEQAVLAVLEFPRLKKLRLAVSSVSTETLARLAALENLEELLLQDAPLADQGLAALLEKMPELQPTYASPFERGDRRGARRRSRLRPAGSAGFD